jgi:anti-anti-sigma factor
MTGDELVVELRAAKLVVAGELDTATEERFLEAIAALESAECEIDLSGLSFLGSAGLRALLRMRREHPRVRIAGISPPVARVLQLTETTDIILGE